MNDETSLSQTGRWCRFIGERFSPVKHLPLIACFYGANLLAAIRSTGSRLPTPGTMLMGAVAVLLIFFHLRIFDEIKDYETDLTVHPDRPLPRGLLTVAAAKRTAFALIALELFLGLLIGPAAFVALCGTVLYSLVMYREFFAREWLRPRLATYAVTHTVIACWMGLFVFSTATGRPFWTPPPAFSLFILADWMVFNVFEFGRKTFGAEEEEAGVDSYSGRFGPAGAAVAVVAMALVAVSAVSLPEIALRLHAAARIAMAGLMSVTVGAAVLYATSPCASRGKLFRGACSAFILCYNAIVVAGLGWM
jgi:4-hydroxybenzoate polyprenyltransferase